MKENSPPLVHIALALIGGLFVGYILIHPLFEITGSALSYLKPLLPFLREADEFYENSGKALFALLIRLPHIVIVALCVFFMLRVMTHRRLFYYSALVYPAYFLIVSAISIWLFHIGGYLANKNG
jgi:hypothetical protein